MPSSAKAPSSQSSSSSQSAEDEIAFPFPTSKTPAPGKAPQMDSIHEGAAAPIKKLLEKQIALSEQIIAQNKKIQRRMTMMAVAGWIKLAILFIPIVLGILYLPPLIEQIVDQYQQFFGVSSGGNSLIEVWKNALQ